MSTELPTKKQSLKHNQRIVIVASTYNAKFTNALVENCVSELQEGAPFLEIEVVRVPGAFEVPVMVKRAICAVPAPHVPNVVIALGVILRGSTAHADLIGASITENLLRIACDTMTPVIHEVLLLDDERQAFARCIASSLNRGREAARTALSMLEIVDDQDAVIWRARRGVPIDPGGSLYGTEK